MPFTEACFLPFHAFCSLLQWHFKNSTWGHPQHTYMLSLAQALGIVKAQSRDDDVVRALTRPVLGEHIRGAVGTGLVPQFQGRVSLPSFPI